MTSSFAWVSVKRDKCKHCDCVLLMAGEEPIARVADEGQARRTAALMNAAIDAAIEEEREACERIAETIGKPIDGTMRHTIAAAIRARTSKGGKR